MGVMSINSLMLSNMRAAESAYSQLESMTQMCLNEQRNAQHVP